MTLHISPHFILTTNLQGSCLIADEKTEEVGGEELIALILEPAVKTGQTLELRLQSAFKP